MLQLILISSIAYTLYYFLCLAKKPKLHFNQNPNQDSFWNDKLKIPKILNQIWYPPFFLGISHLQNLFYEGIILKSHETYYDERVELLAEDGGIFAIDIKYPEGAATSSKSSKESQNSSPTKSNANVKNEQIDKSQIKTTFLKDKKDLKEYRSQFKSLQKHSKTKMTLKLHNNNNTTIMDESTDDPMSISNNSFTFDENNNPIFPTPENSDTPKIDFKVDEVVLIYPGITGKSPDPYIKRLVNNVDHITKDRKLDRKILTAVMIQRGYDGLEISNTCKKLNGVTNILDLKMALKYLDNRFNKTGIKGHDKVQEAESPEKVSSKSESKNTSPIKTNSNDEKRRSIIRIVAFSFGAIQTRLLLGGPMLTKEERKSSWYPKAVLCNSCPFNLMQTTFEKFEVGLAGLFYNRQITKRMASILDKHKLLPPNYTLPSLLQTCKVMRHLDKIINAPSWGYDNWRDYYNAATITEEHLNNIEIPVIFLNSVDDPLIKDAPDRDEWFTNTKWVMLVKTAAGGHGAFLRLGWLLKSSLDQRTYFEELFDDWLEMNF